MNKIFAILLLLICQSAIAGEWVTETTVDEMDGATKSVGIVMSETGESLNLICERKENRALYAWVDTNKYLGSGRISVQMKYKPRDKPSGNKIETLKYRIDNTGTSFFVGVRKNPSAGPVTINESDFGSVDEYLLDLNDRMEDLVVETSFFFQRVFNSEYFVFRYQPYRENTRTVKFITKGAEKDLTDIIKNCQLESGVMLNDKKWDDYNRFMNKGK